MCVLTLTLHSHLQRLRTDLDFKGHFHQTRSRRLPGGLKIIGALAACGIGGLGVNFLVRIKTGGTIPPYTWARTVDQKTRDEVEATLAVGFNMARNSAPHQRNDALREATFQVPHELARLNKDAPDFRLEDLGPPVDGKKIWDRVGERFTSLVPFIDFAEEARVFLYFPNGATKATAVFVAVNAELKYPLRKPQQSTAGDAVMNGAHAATEVDLLANFWGFQHNLWAQSHPAVIGLLEEMERLPVIFKFRDKAFGALYYTRLGLIFDSSMCVTPLNISHLDR